MLRGLLALAALPAALCVLLPQPATVQRPQQPALLARRVPTAPQMQQGPLEEGFKELLVLNSKSAEAEGNVEQEIVDRMEEEVRALTGVGLEDLLNPSKVVNYERERLLLEVQIAECKDAEELEKLEARQFKVVKQLNAEKRTVFRGWLKAVFVGQAAIAVVVGGVAAFDAFPTFSLDLSLRALGFWSYWLFVIPSLRARRPRGWEKKALNIAFLGSPVVTFAMPFVTKDPGLIWTANLAVLVGCYAFGYATGRDGDEVSSFSGPLRWLDFGSGQERGMTAAQREAYAARQAAKERDAAAAAESEVE